MDLIIVLHDNKENTHKKMRITFKNDATIAELQKEICSTWLIDQKYQELICNGRSLIEFDTFQEAKLKHKDEIIVKHSLLEDYITFLDCIECVKKKHEDQKQQKANRALDIIDRLKKAGFFNVYTRLEREQKQLMYGIAHMFDKDLENIKKAIELFFNSPNTIEYSVKSDGAQKGIKCHLSKEGTTRTYFVKMPCKRASRSSSAVDDVDLRELFIYQLFNLIGIAPSVFFLPNAHLSSVELYIATLEVPGFKRTQKDKKKESQLSLIQKLFYVSDLHSNNYGEDDKGSLFVVDFQIDYVPNSEKAEKLWKKLKSELSLHKLRIAKKIFYEWDLLTKINEADNIINGLDFFRQLNCNHDKYQAYMTKIRGNVETFQRKFNSLS